MTQTWDLWYPKAAAAGLPFARCKIDPVNTLLVHSAPPVLTVFVMDEQGNQIAQGVDLPATQDSPMTRLTLSSGQVHREDLWPQESDLGQVVVLPGGEAGRLLAWWNNPGQSEWRWQVEFYNQT